MDVTRIKSEIYWINAEKFEYILTFVQKKSILIIIVRTSDNASEQTDFAGSAHAAITSPCRLLIVKNPLRRALSERPPFCVKIQRKMIAVEGKPQRGMH